MLRGHLQSGYIDTIDTDVWQHGIISMCLHRYMPMFSGSDSAIHGYVQTALIDVVLITS